MEIIEWCNKNQGFIMAVLTGVYVLATIGIALLGARANSISQRNVATLTEIERERSRPLVQVTIESDAPSLTLKVSNNGQTPAYDVRISTTPQLQVILAEKNRRPLGVIEHGIGSLGSSASVSSFVGFFPSVKSAYPEMRFTGSVTYRASTGKTYETPVDLDVRYMENSAHIDRKTIHDVANQLEKIQSEIHLLATGHNKPHVITEDIVHKRAADEAQYAEFRRKQKEAKAGAGQPEADVVAET